MRYLLGLVLALAAWPCLAAESVSLASLDKGDELVLETERGNLTFTVTDPRTGEGWLDGQKAKLLGSTQGRQDGYLLIDMGVAKEGFRLEVEIQGKRYLTAPVKKIARTIKTA